MRPQGTCHLSSKQIAKCSSLEDWKLRTNIILRGILEHDLVLSFWNESSVRSGLEFKQLDCELQVETRPDGCSH